MFRLWAVLIGYLFGCFQTAYLVTKLFKGADIRELGSGNAGTANVAATVGRAAGWITLAGDALKTFAAIMICRFLFPEDKALAAIYAGTGVVLGHDWPFWNRFRGGKGVVCTAATMMFFWPVVAFGTLAVWLLSTGCFLWHLPVLGCILTVLGCPVLMAVTGYPWECVLLAFVLGVIGAFMLRDNIKAAHHKTQQKLGLATMIKRLFGGH